MQPDELKIVQGYIPGMIGRIAEMHGSYYSREHNFGRFFEAKVASGWLSLVKDWRSPVTRFGWQCSTTKLSARWRSMARIWRRVKPIFAGLFLMMAAGDTAWEKTAE
jgi:hypothetical protein